MKPVCKSQVRAAIIACLAMSGARFLSAETCVSSGDFRVCADWSLANDPLHVTDFRVTFQDPNPPIIELRTGDDGWVIYVQNTLDDSPGDLTALLLDPSNPTENFVVTLANGVQSGANHVGTIELTSANWIGRSGLAEGSRIAGDLNGDLTVVDETLSVGLWLDIGGDVTAASTITASKVDWLFVGTPAEDGTPTGTLAGTLSLTNSIELFGRVDIGTLTGVIDLHDRYLGGLLLISYGGSGQIVRGGRILIGGAVDIRCVGSPFSGSATFESVALGGSIRARQGTFQGGFTVNGDMSGTISVGLSGFSPAATIDILGDVDGLVRLFGGGQGTGHGTIHIAGDVQRPDGQPSIEIQGTLGDGGRILIDGSLRSGDSGTNTPEITIGALSAGAGLSVDFDGWNLGDDWSDAEIVVGTNSYFANTPSVHLWEIQPCRGDMNNDGAVNNFDIDPFVLALIDPEIYSETFPGLEGSRVYHGDCNCDGLFNNFDINAFVARLAEEENGCCDAGCPGCQYFGPNEQREPKSVAAQLATNVSRERYDGMRIIVADVAANEENSDGEYWAAVLDYLE
ncbi:MAG: hypothetical protein JNG88_16620 [Phycisphaerales bacterium]|nr:hypothetical protein [Phycisphaerales bacterium]